MSHSLPRVLFVGRADWANLCHVAARAIEHVLGPGSARVFTHAAHPFEYVEDLVGSEARPAALDLASRADWLVTTGDANYEFFWDFCEEASPRADVRLAATHPGTAYRLQDPTAVPILGCHDAIVPAVPVPVAADEPVRIAHSPSARVTKGTEPSWRCSATSPQIRNSAACWRWT